MVNLSDLKLNSIRNTFDIIVNGEIQEIVVFNIVGETRVKFIDKLKELSDKGIEGNDVVEEMYTDLFLEATNIVLDDEMKEVLNAPSSDMLMVMNEVLNILHEMQIEQLIYQSMQMNELEKIAFAQNTILKAEKINKIQEHNKKLENELKELDKQLEGESDELQ